MLSPVIYSGVSPALNDSFPCAQKRLLCLFKDSVVKCTWFRLFSALVSGVYSSTILSLCLPCTYSTNAATFQACSGLENKLGFDYFIACSSSSVPHLHMVSWLSSIEIHPRRQSVNRMNAAFRVRPLGLWHWQMAGHADVVPVMCHTPNQDFIQMLHQQNVLKECSIQGGSCATLTSHLRLVIYMMQNLQALCNWTARKSRGFTKLLERVWLNEQCSSKIYSAIIQQLWNDEG